MHLEIKKPERTFSIIDLSEEDAQRLVALIGGVQPVSGALYEIWSELGRELSPRKYTLNCVADSIHRAPFLELRIGGDDVAKD